MVRRLRWWSGVRVALAGLVLAALASGATAAEVGQIKVVRGAVHVERGGERLPAAVGMRVHQADVVVTGADGSCGITFIDNSLLSVGPHSVLAIDRFAFNPTTHEGSFETSLRRGTLAAVSGRIARQTPGAMRVRTPASILGVRGTEFLVRTTDVGR